MKTKNELIQLRNERKNKTLYDEKFATKLSEMNLVDKKSIRQIANETKISKTTVHRWIVQYLSEAGSLRVKPEREINNSTDKKQIATYLTVEEIERLDKHIKEKHPYMKISRSKYLRKIILDHVEYTC